MIAKFLAVIWLIVIAVLVTVAGIERPRLDTSMLSLLPASQQQPIVKAASEQMGQQFSRRLLLVINAEDKSLRQQATQQLAAKLSALPEVASVIWQVDGDGLTGLQNSLFPYRYALLTSAMAAQIDAGNTDAIQQQALAALLSPIGMEQTELVKDPFGLQRAWILQKTADLKINQQDGFLRLNKKPTSYLLIVSLAGDAFSIPTQQAVMGAYQPVINDMAAKGVTIQTAGLLVHAAAGAEQAQKEMSTIGVGSLLGILLLMLWVFRKIRLVGVVLLPVFIGCLVASATAFIVFERVHVMTFAFGAGLIGVAVDYSLHFLCERQVRDKVIRHILPGLLLGLASSVLAYAAQAMAPFPGLRQMALFSVTGLIATWLTVVLWLPLLTRKMPISTVPLRLNLVRWQQTWPSIERYPKTIGVILLILTLVCLLLIAKGKSEDDIRLLQTSSPALMAHERAIQTLLGFNNSTQFLLLPCQQLQGCLEREAVLKQELETLKQQGVITRYDLVSEAVPSLQQQQKNVDRVAALYQAQLAALYTTLGLPDSLYQQAMQAFNEDKANWLLPEAYPNATSLAQSTQIIETPSAGSATIITFAGNRALDQNDLAQFRQQIPELLLVDQVGAISHLMKTYRQQILLWVVVAYAFVFLILAYRYKLAVWRIILPPLLASLYTLALLMTWLPGVNLFHMMALILVLGIGVDTGIFLSETHYESQTWLAVTLSIMTSLMAFGLLAMSQTPVLMHFGLTVLFGLVFVWILTTLLRQPPTQGESFETPIN